MSSSAAVEVATMSAIAAAHGMFLIMQHVYVKPIYFFVMILFIDSSL